MPSPTTLKKKYSVYSRCSRDRDRSRQVQYRLPRKATVAEKTVAMIFASSGLIAADNPILKIAVSRTYATPPTTPNLPSSRSRCSNRPTSARIPCGTDAGAATGDGSPGEPAGPGDDRARGALD